MKSKNQNEVVLANFSDQDLIVLRDRVLQAHEDCIEGWAEELGIICDDKFDEYSNSGIRKINKLTKKWSEKLATIELSIEMVQEELEKRDYYNEQKKYLNGENFETRDVSDDEFLKIEQNKTEKIKSILYDNDED